MEDNWRVIRASCSAFGSCSLFPWTNYDEKCWQSFLFNGTLKLIRPGINFTHFFFFFPSAKLGVHKTHTDTQHRSYHPYSSSRNQNGMACWCSSHSFEFWVFMVCVLLDSGWRASAAIREEINCNSLWNRKRQFPYYAAIKKKSIKLAKSGGNSD